MKKTLIKLYQQVDKRGFDQSELIIRVEANISKREHTAEVTQLLSVHAYDCKSRIYTDLTAIFFECFHDQAEAIVNDINWYEVYRESKNVAA